MVYRFSCSNILLSGFNLTIGSNTEINFPFLGTSNQTLIKASFNLLAPLRPPLSLWVCIVSLSPPRPLLINIIKLRCSPAASCHNSLALKMGFHANDWMGFFFARYLNSILCFRTKRPSATSNSDLLIALFF